MPLIWRIPNSYPEWAIGQYDSAVSPNYFLFNSGQPVGQLPSPTIRFSVPVEQLLRFDCLAHSGGIPLVSKRIGVLLSRMCSDEVQLLPTVIQATDDKIFDYCLVNATRRVAAVDYSESSFVLISGTKAIRKFLRLRHRPDALGGIQLARERDYLSHMLVSEVLADELLSMGAAGLHFMRPEDVHP